MSDSKNSRHQRHAAFDEASHRRADVYQAILALERAAARPAAAREEQWVTGVIEALAQFEREIVEHIENTERPEGLFAEIIDIAPRLSHNVQLLATNIPRCLRPP